MAKKQKPIKKPVKRDDTVNPEPTPPPKKNGN